MMYPALFCLTSRAKIFFTTTVLRSLLSRKQALSPLLSLTRSFSTFKSLTICFLLQRRIPRSWLLGIQQPENDAHIFQQICSTYTILFKPAAGRWFPLSLNEKEIFVGPSKSMVPMTFSFTALPSDCSHLIISQTFNILYMVLTSICALSWVNNVARTVQNKGMTPYM